MSGRTGSLWRFKPDERRHSGFTVLRDERKKWQQSNVQMLRVLCRVVGGRIWRRSPQTTTPTCRWYVGKLFIFNKLSQTEWIMHFKTITNKNIHKYSRYQEVAKSLPYLSGPYITDTFRWLFFWLSVLWCMACLCNLVSRFIILLNTFCNSNLNLFLER